MCVGCGGQAAAGAEKPKQVSAIEGEGLGVGDIFEVRVFGEKDLSGKYRVPGDGFIDFPFVGRISVMGKTTTVVAADISKALKDGQFLLEPYVSAVLVEANSRRISVIGAVAKPGTFPLTVGLTAVQAISLAGGFSPLADRDKTVVTRREGENLKRYMVPMKRISAGHADDFSLRSGDIVFVPERVF